MREKSFRLLRVLGDVDEALLEDAERPAPGRRWPALAVSAAAVVCVLLGVHFLSASPAVPADPDTTPAQESTGPLTLADLPLPEVTTDPALAAVNAGETMDIKAFEEQDLARCAAILEGTVTAMEPRHYTYDYYDDKFGPTELYHGFYDTVVYTLTVERVWYGAAFAPGDSVQAEDLVYFMESPLPLITGRRYVIPLADAGPSLQTLTGQPLASGNLTRASSLTTLYPFHPQITVTEDGNYLVTADWETLAAEPCQTVRTDDPGFYGDQLRLLGPDIFAERLTALLKALHPEA